MFDKKDFSQLLEAMRDSLQDKSQTQFDFQEGSVVRTLFESFAYEMAVLYEQMERVYLSGYVDSAEDTDLDKVVAVLGIKRGEPEYATGKVTFERDVGIDEEIEIPINTLVTTEDTDKNPKKAYKTIEIQTIPEGDSSVIVRVQAEQPGRIGETETETIVIMPQPVTGIKSVYNQEAVRFSGKERETDTELRDRAKETLLSASGANTASIKNALLSIPGVKEVKIKEPFDNPESQVYGLIDVFVDAVDFEDLKLQLESKIEQVRAAGIYVRLKAPIPVKLDAIFQIQVNPQLKFSQESERQSFEQTVANEIKSYLEQLTIGQSLVYTKFIRHLLSVPGVDDLNEVAIAIYKDDNRTEYTLSELVQQKQLAIIDNGKIYPNRIKIVLGEEKLPLLIIVKFQFTEIEGIAKQDIIDYLNNFFQQIEIGKPIVREDFLKYLKNKKNKIKINNQNNNIKIQEETVQLSSNYSQDVREEQIDVSYLEQPRVDEENLFVYSKIFKLIGAIKFTTIEPATTEDKESYQNKIEEHINTYLNNLKSQESVNIKDLRNAIQNNESKIIINEFDQNDFRIVIGGNQEQNVENDKISVVEFEKVKLGHICITNDVENINVEVTELQLQVIPSESSVLAEEIRKTAAEELNKAVSKVEEITNKSNQISENIKEVISDELNNTSSEVENVINDENNTDLNQTPSNPQANASNTDNLITNLSNKEQKEIKKAARNAINNFPKPQQGNNLKYENIKQSIENAINANNITTLQENNHAVQVTKLTLQATSHSDERIQIINIEQSKDIHVRSVEIINSISPPSEQKIEIILNNQ
ncbi:MAG: baseplate J/gp47 family protein [Cyanobacteria bacterium P01_A01_bin.68]